MNQGWKITELAKACKVFKDGDWIESKDQATEGIRLIQTGNVGVGVYLDKEKRAKFISEQTFKRLRCTEVLTGDILVSRLPDPVGRSCIVPNISSRLITAVDCTIIRTNEKLLPEFLKHYQLSNTYLKDVDSWITGTTRSRISRKNLGLIKVPIPPLPEQKRIVAILDRCFEAIDKARANVERNLQNAKDLFQSQLNQIFTLRGDGWVEKKLGECIRLKSGDGLTAKNMIHDGCYPVYGGNGIAGNHDIFNIEGSQVIIGRVGALCGNARHINEKIWLTDNAFRVSEFFYEFDNSFLTYLLNYKNLRNYARQAAQPVISNSSTKDILLQFPEDVCIQNSIVNQLDELKVQTQSLGSGYQQELVVLDELKKSILQRAFNGELTETEEAAV